jgi:serine protein kinase
MTTTETTTDTGLLLGDLARDYKKLFHERQVILPFSGFLALVKHQPRRMIRNAPEYVRDTFHAFGWQSPVDARGRKPAEDGRFKLFDIGTERGVPIVGGETVQSDIHNLIQGFVRQGMSNKLILLHGPNGSAKSSTIEAISWAMQRYSESDAGAVYRFNWVFPTEKTSAPRVKGESGPIGFASREEPSGPASYALLDESQISSRITSEFKENPIFLIPMPQRERWLREWIAAAEGIRPEDVEIPEHVRMSGLSKRNQLIFETLFAAYDGDLDKVLRHVQVERFFYSRQYRVGISTVEPQMAIDAQEKQLTMDKNISNLPSVLHNIRFHEAQGELVEANRGILEFSDLLKRPVEAFKYLLNTVEKGTLSLPSSTHQLDLVFFATANEKHLDAFKTLPDFSSFRGRFELVTVPYLLRPSLETKIYEPDIRAISKVKRVGPHSLRLLCTWAVMTRLKQADPEAHESSVRSLIARLDPRNKIRLYEGEPLQGGFKPAEESTLRDLRNKIATESVGMVVYEGRFGASPREIRAILQRAAQSSKYETLLPMAIFDELERLVKDRSVYEFLQFEPRGKYHDAALFVRMLQEEFADIFESEVTRSMTLVEEGQYDTLLQRYVENIVAEVKREKIYNPKTTSYEAPNQQLMRDVEKILGVQGSAERHRENILARIAAWKVENPSAKLDFGDVFHDILRKIQDHYWTEKAKVIEANWRAMLLLGSDEERNLSAKEIEQARSTYNTLESRFGYNEKAARDCLKFLLNINRTRKRGS